MSKCVVAGDVVVITSAMKMADLKKIKKYRKPALTLRGGEDGKEPIFAVDVNETGKGSISPYGVGFNSESRDGQYLSSITVPLNLHPGMSVAESVAEEYGTAINLLNQLEATLPAVVEAIDAEKATIMESVTIAQ